MHTDWNHEVKVADECKYEKEDYKPEYKPEYKAPTYDKKYGGYSLSTDDVCLKLWWS